MGDQLIPLGTGSESATGLAQCPTSPPAREQSGEPLSRDLIKEIATDIGKDTAAYIEVMYPKAVEATSSTFKLSVRNHIHNQIMAALELRDEEGVNAWLRDRKRHRRDWLATYRKIRKHDVASLSEVEKIRELADRVRLRERGWIPVSGYIKNITFTVEEAKTVEKALLLLADLEDRTIDHETDEPRGC